MTQPQSTPARTPAPPPGLFVREDVSKPENRVNLALLGILMVPAFRHWFLGRMNLLPDSIIYPPQNVGTIRPDLVIVGPDNFVRAWVEIELGGEDTQQLAVFRDRLHPDPVRSIVGLRDRAPDDLATSLEELADVATNCLSEVLDRQQRMNVQMFVDLVAETRRTTTVLDYAVPEERVREDPIPHLLAARMGSRLSFGKPPFGSGQLQVTTITQNGWTLRCFARGTAYGSISLLWKQAIPGSTVRVPSSRQLGRYLNQDALDGYRRFFKEILDVDLDQIAGQQSHGVDEARLLVVVDSYLVALQTIISSQR